MSPARRPSRTARAPATRGGVQFLVQLDGILPAIWRRLLVRDDATLSQLHRVIQVAMGWQDCHLHEFEIAGQRYGMPGEDAPQQQRDARRIRLAALALPVGARFEYRYDLGDYWVHRLVVEAPLADALPLTTGLGRCLGGARAAPPEDCGGAGGYLEFLRAMANPRHPQHAEFREWIGGGWDPEGFDAAVVDRALRRSR
jgi:hypothetical protein